MAPFEVRRRVRGDGTEVVRDAFDRPHRLK